jgi:hypothetical protein
MKASGVANLVKKFYRIKRPLFIHGPVGVGKSEVVRNVAKDLNVGLIDVRLSQLDPVDLRGIPVVSGNTTVWKTPDFLPKSGSGILFFDEANSAPQSIQAAMYQLVLDRKLGDYTLPDGWNIFLAGNRAIDKSITHRMGDALKNRMGHVEFTLDLDDWCKIAIDRNFHHGILAFNRYKPSALHYMAAGLGHTDQQNAQKQAMSEQMALNTPRSWEMLSEALADNEPMDPVDEGEMINGIIGESTGAMFQGYLKIYRKLQSPEEIIMSPKTAKVDEDPGVLYATMTGIASRATEANFESVMQYVERCPADFQILALRDCMARNRQLLTTTVFNKWAAKYASVLF